jgi:hypothetical protein
MQGQRSRRSIQAWAGPLWELGAWTGDSERLGRSEATHALPRTLFEVGRRGASSLVSFFWLPIGSGTRNKPDQIFFALNVDQS